ncbi:MAG TPA: CvpA family protein [bacterium]|nr:CvpA family protein [bacterium]
MNWVDWVILATAAFSILAGFLDGFVRTILSLIAVVVAFLVASRYSAAPAHVLTKWMAPDLANAGGFIAVFIGVLIVFALLSILVRSTLEKLSLSGLDRLMGAAFGAIRAAAILGLLALLIDNFGAFQATRASKTFPYALTSGRILLQLIPESAKKHLNLKILEEGKENQPRDKKKSPGNGEMI